MNTQGLPAFQLQSKAESKAKRLGWGARLEAAAQAGAGVQVRATIVRKGHYASGPRHDPLECFLTPVAVRLTYYSLCMLHTIWES